MGFLATIFIYLIVLIILLVLLLIFPAPPQNQSAKEETAIEEKDQTNQPVVPQIQPDIEPDQEIQDRSVTLIEFPEAQLPEDASPTVKAEYEYNHKVREITKSINAFSKGNIKPINFCYVDRLINIRGKSRPIPFFIPPLSSQLSPSGVFIYDTTRLAKDRALYFFVGPEADQFLQDSGEELLELMKEDTKCDNVIRIIRDMECDDFKRMIHQMGGSTIMIQSAHNYGDQFYFQNVFFKSLLHIFCFDNEDLSTLDDLDFDTLSDTCSVVIDTSDNALYLYVAHVDPQDQVEKDTQTAAIQYMSDQEEFKNRELLVFDKSTIPPNLRLLFKKQQ